MNPDATGSESTSRRPPQAVEAEAAVLGAALLDPEAVPLVIKYLKPEHFYLPAHGKVFEAVCSLFERNSPTDIVTVTSELKRMKQLEAVGGQQFLTTLLDNVLTTAHCEEHARLVLDKAMLRQLIATATEIVQESYDDSRQSREVVEDAEQRIFAIAEGGKVGGFLSVKDLLMPEMNRIDQAAGEHRLVTGVETGFTQLDHATSGLQRGELVIIAGRPSMGKTAFALNIAVHAAVKRKLPVAIFSLEMSTESLVQRLLCAEASVSMRSLRLARLTREEHARLAAACGPLSEAEVLIDDSPGLSALDMRARARRATAEREIGLVIIDYLQLMEAPGERRRDRNRQQEISDTTRALKAMAKELNVPVIAISQLSRAPETRGGEKRPQLSDLRESGAIEQDADLVVLLYRGEFYEPENEGLQGKAEAIIAKQRNGPLDKIDLTFLKHCMRFVNPYGHELPEPPQAGADDVLP